jgi:hypothetical protein
MIAVENLPDVRTHQYEYACLHHGSENTLGSLDVDEMALLVVSHQQGHWIRRMCVHILQSLLSQHRLCALDAIILDMLYYAHVRGMQEQHQLDVCP